MPFLTPCPIFNRVQSLGGIELGVITYRFVVPHTFVYGNFMVRLKHAKHFGGKYIMFYSVEEIDKDNDLYEKTVAMRCVDLYPVGRVTRSYIQDELEDQSILLVALKNRKVLGCGRLTLRGETIELSHMVVGEEYRFTGVGTSLMHKFLQRAHEIGAKKIHLEATPEAVPFFERFGFIVVGKTKKLEILDLPAVDMECDLKI